MANKKSSRKKKANPMNTVRHKAERQKRHQKRLEKFRENAKIKEELLEKAKVATKLGTVGLGKLIGTLNINRLTDVVENRYLNAPWYLLRQKKSKEKSNAKKTNEIKDIISKINETMYSNSETKKKNKKRQNEGISKGPSKGN